MKQQCKCGNWVEGKVVATLARKATRKLVGKGGSKAIGAAAGFLVGGPLGAGLGLAASVLLDDKMKDVSDGVEDFLFDENTAEYEFKCPKCGRTWRTSKLEEELNTIAQEETEEADETNATDKEQEKFNKHFYWCAKHTEDAIADYSKIEQKFRNIINNNVSSDVVKSEYYFLLSWMKLEELLSNDFWDFTTDDFVCDTKGINKGSSYITNALKYLSGDTEYQYIKGIYSLWNKNYEKGLQYILNHEAISKKENGEVYLLNTDYLNSLWKKTSVCFLERQIDINKDNAGEEELWTNRIKRLVDRFNYAKDKPQKHPEYFDLWLTMADKLAFRYASGTGCEVNFEKALKLVNVTTENGRYSGMFLLACFYAHGNGVEQDVEKGKYYLLRILDSSTPGTYWYDKAKEKMDELMSTTTADDSLQTTDNEEQERFNTLFDWCAENISQAYDDFEELENKCTDQMETASDVVKSGYYFLLAWMKLEYLISTSFLDENKEAINRKDIKKGQDYIRKAIELVNEVNEYNLFQSIYSLWDMDYDDGIKCITDFNEKSIDFTNNFLKNEYLQTLWKKNAMCYVKYQYGYVADYDDEDYDEARLWFERLKELREEFSYAQDYCLTDDENPYFELWCYLTNDLMMSYAYGDGCDKDLYRAHGLAEALVERYDYRGLYWLASVYAEDGEDQNLALARKLYQRIIEEDGVNGNFYNLANKEIENLPDTSATHTADNAEQEYIETLKDILAEGEISDRERRLLDKLRVKLGISIERAKELEASLVAPQLSEEEQEYLNEYRDIIADGEITARERKLLDKICKMNGISAERAKELESLDKKQNTNLKGYE